MEVENSPPQKREEGPRACLHPVGGGAKEQYREDCDENIVRIEVPAHEQGCKDDDSERPFGRTSPARAESRERSHECQPIEGERECSPVNRRGDAGCDRQSDAGLPKLSC